MPIVVGGGDRDCGVVAAWKFGVAARVRGSTSLIQFFANGSRHHVTAVLREWSMSLARTAKESHHPFHQWVSTQYPFPDPRDNELCHVVFIGNLETTGAVEHSFEDGPDRERVREQTTTVDFTSLDPTTSVQSPSSSTKMAEFPAGVFLNQSLCSMHMERNFLVAPAGQFIF